MLIFLLPKVFSLKFSSTKSSSLFNFLSIILTSIERFSSKYCWASSLLIHIWSPQIKTVFGLLQLDKIKTKIAEIDYYGEWERFEFSNYKDMNFESIILENYYFNEEYIEQEGKLVEIKDLCLISSEKFSVPATIEN